MDKSTVAQVGKRTVAQVGKRTVAPVGKPNSWQCPTKCSLGCAIQGSQPLRLAIGFRATPKASTLYVKWVQTLGQIRLVPKRLICTYIGPTSAPRQDANLYTYIGPMGPQILHFDYLGRLAPKMFKMAPKSSILTTFHNLQFHLGY